MSIIFPSLKPTARSCKMGAYATKTYRALSGAVTKRSFGNKPFSYELSLEFKLGDADAALILQHYNDVRAGFVKFPLPTSLFAGMSTTLQALIQAPTTILWEYAEPPTLQSESCKFYSVSVRLMGEMI